MSKLTSFQYSLQTSTLSTTFITPFGNTEVVLTDITSINEDDAINKSFDTILSYNQDIVNNQKYDDIDNAPILEKIEILTKQVLEIQQQIIDLQALIK